MFKHEHPLTFIDLQPNYPICEEGYDDDGDDDDNLVTRKNYRCCRCYRCNKEINYYYECAHLCEYALHKFCGELPLELKHTFHLDHMLSLV